MLFERLLSGAVLSTEDLIDLLTLKDNASNEEKNDYTYALDIVARDTETPRGRLQVSLSTIWRRIYLRDDWTSLRQNTSNLSDEAISSALRSTALYSTLLALAARNPDKTLHVRPSKALYSNSTEEEEAVRARFSSSSTYSKVSIDGLLTGYEYEGRELTKLVQGSHTALEDLYDEVERLVALTVEECADVENESMTMA